MVELRLRFRNRFGVHARKVDLSAVATIISTGFKAADNVLGRKRRETFNLLYLRRAGYTDFLSVPHPFTQHLSRHPILRLRFHRCDEPGTAVMGEADAEVNIVVGYQLSVVSKERQLLS